MKRTPSMKKEVVMKTGKPLIAAASRRVALSCGRGAPRAAGITARVGLHPTSARWANHGWFLPATYQGRQGGRGRPLRPPRSETTFRQRACSESDAERAIEQFARTGHDIVFTTSFGFMEPTLAVAARYPDVKFEHATGLQARRQRRHLRGEVPRGPLHHRPDRRAHVGERHHRLCRRLPDPRGDRRHQRLHARRAVDRPRDRAAGRMGEFLVRPRPRGGTPPPRCSTRAST